MIYVDVCGAVANPGVFSWQPGAGCFRRLSGGRISSRGSSNLCKPCRSSDRWTAALYSHTGRDGAAGAGSGRDVRGIRWTDEWKCRDRTEHGMNAQVQQDNRININTADEAQLTTLTGIGATRAQADHCLQRRERAICCDRGYYECTGYQRRYFCKDKR